MVLIALSSNLFFKKYKMTTMVYIPIGKCTNKGCNLPENVSHCGISTCEWNSIKTDINTSSPKLMYEIMPWIFDNYFYLLCNDIFHNLSSYISKSVSSTEVFINKFFMIKAPSNEVLWHESHSHGQDPLQCCIQSRQSRHIRQA